MANKNEKATFDAAGKSEAFFTKYRNVILGAVAAIILVVAAVVCYNTFIGGPREDKASTALARGQEYFNAEQFDKALNGDGAGYAGFVKIASDYGSTDATALMFLPFLQIRIPSWSGPWTLQETEVGGEHVT